MTHKNMNPKTEILDELIESSKSIDSLYFIDDELFEAADRLYTWIEQVTHALEAAQMTQALDAWTEASNTRQFSPGGSFSFEINEANFKSDVKALRAVLIGIRESLEPSAPGDDFIYVENFEKTKSYIRHIAQQVNGCYRHGWYDACAVMVRRLIEVLIFDCFDAYDALDNIKNSKGSILPLGELVDAFLKEPSSLWHVERNASTAIRRLKELGDSAAHGRYHKTLRQSLDNHKEALGVAIQQLIGIIGRAETHNRKRE